MVLIMIITNEFQNVPMLIMLSIFVIGAYLSSSHSDVHFLNDNRSKIKLEINKVSGSNIQEIKSRKGFVVVITHRAAGDGLVVEREPVRAEDGGLDDHQDLTVVREGLKRREILVRVGDEDE